MRQTLIDNPCADDIVKNTILEDFYVDDMLKSVQTVDSAKAIIHGVKQLLATGGFKLMKFATNHEDLSKLIPNCEKVTDTKFLKPLGLTWCASDDQLYFHDPAMKTDRITKRIMLSCIAAIYDPLGLMTPLIISGKLLFQDVSRMQLGWDEEIPQALHTKWISWARSFRRLEDLTISRCLQPADFDDAYVELHHFCDASMAAYGCCTYLRLTNKAGRVRNTLILAKGRLAPIKPVTIPRLELSAAVLSAKMDALLCSELRIKIDKRYFWTDSTIVLQYLNNRSKRFHTYVANRVGTILRFTDPASWHHIPSAQNAADILTRGALNKHFDDKAWFKGPCFLNEYHTNWPVEVAIPELCERDSELKCHVAQMCSVGAHRHPIETLAEHYSSWYALKKAVCWLKRIFQKLRNKTATSQKSITVAEMKEAAKLLIERAQENLTDDKSRERRTLNLYRGDDGLYRVGGRLQHALSGAKHQIYVPSGHIATLIVRDVHTRFGHVGREYVLAEVRQVYWISRKTVKSVLSKCVTCMRKNKPPHEQVMGQLPEERVTAYGYPFQFTGIDCFGPFMIKKARSEVKRYGCIFVCMASRAVHLEKLDTMETDSFINSLQRFIARRGRPSIIMSDQGTNFAGADNEISRAIKAWNNEQITSEMLQLNVEWKYNPPHASHMGGSWEALIKSVRNVLTTLLPANFKPSDEVMETLFCMVECILNNRPITKSSDDVNDLSPLRPNDLLLMREAKPLEVITSPSDLYKKRWKQVQYLSNTFWSRWIKEYLPELQRRQKWMKPRRDIKIGDLVLLVEGTPRNVWPLALVKEVNTAQDGHVRSVVVKTRSSLLVRPISKIVLLEGVCINYPID